MIKEGKNLDVIMLADEFYPQDEDGDMDFTAAEMFLQQFDELLADEDPATVKALENTKILFVTSGKDDFVYDQIKKAPKRPKYKKLRDSWEKASSGTQHETAAVSRIVGNVKASWKPEETQQAIKEALIQYDIARPSEE